MTATPKMITVGIQGPSGPAPATYLTTPFTVPAVNASANASVANAAWIVLGSWVQIAGVGVFQVSSLAPLQFKNTGADGLPPVGTVVPIDTPVAVSGPPGLSQTEVVGLIIAFS